MDRLVRRFVQITVRFHHESIFGRLLDFGAVGKPDLNAGALDIFLSGPRLLSVGRGNGPPHRIGDSGIYFSRLDSPSNGMEKSLASKVERSGSHILGETLWLRPRCELANAALKKVVCLSFIIPRAAREGLSARTAPQEAEIRSESST